MIAFNKYYNRFNILSISLVTISLLLLIFKGLNFGIDFKGGTLIELRSNDQKITTSSLRDSLNQMNLGDVSVKNFGNKTDFLIKFENNSNKNVIEEIKFVKKQGKKVIAIGTTSVRALESCYCPIAKEIQPINKNVDLVIKPGFKFKIVDGLLTNFHLPKSSLLLLVSAMIGRERLLELYKKAIREKFRFFSYGDAMFISPDALLEDSKFKT